MYNKIKSKNKINTTILFMFAFLISFISSSTSIYAHKSMQLFAMVDTYSMSFQVTTELDKTGFFSKEAGHYEYKLGDMWGMETIDDALIKSGGKEVKDISKGMKFAWPYIGVYMKTDGSIHLPADDLVEQIWDSVTVWGEKYNDVSGEEIERAVLVGTTVVSGINDAVAVCYKSDGKPKTADELFIRANAVVDAANGSGSAGSCTGFSLSDYDSKGIIYASFTTPEGKYQLPYAMTKGYRGVNGGQPLFNSGIFLKQKSDLYTGGTIDGKPLKGDAIDLSWNDFVYLAEYIYKVSGVTMSNTYDLIKVNVIEEAVIGLFSNVIYSIQSALGLYSTQDLIFADGLRGTDAWMYGIMPNSWFPIILKLHMMFQTIAWSILVLAFVKILMQENLSTMNPVQRQSMYDGIKNLALTFFLLLMVFPISNIIMQMSITLTKFFGGYVPQGFLDGSMGQGGALGTILIMIVYLCINIYLNFLYIIRSIMIAMLLITAPLFLVTIAFGGQWKSYSSFWMKEILSNILLQPVHAISMGTIALMATNARGIERLVFAGSIIFVTQFYQKLLLQGGAGATMMAADGIQNKVAAGVGSYLGGGSKKSNSNDSKSSGGAKNGAKEGADNGKSPVPTSKMGSESITTNKEDLGGGGMKNAAEGKVGKETKTSSSNSGGSDDGLTSASGETLNTGGGGGSSSSGTAPTGDGTSSSSATASSGEAADAGSGVPLEVRNEGAGKAQNADTKGPSLGQRAKDLGQAAHDKTQGFATKHKKGIQMLGSAGVTSGKGLVKLAGSSVKMGVGAGVASAGMAVSLSGVDGGVGKAIIDKGTRTMRAPIDEGASTIKEGIQNVKTGIGNKVNEVVGKVANSFDNWTTPKEESSTPMTENSTPMTNSEGSEPISQSSTSIPEASEPISYNESAGGSYDNYINNPDSPQYGLYDEVPTSADGAEYYQSYNAQALQDIGIQDIRENKDGGMEFFLDKSKMSDTQKSEFEHINNNWDKRTLNSYGINNINQIDSKNPDLIKLSLSQQGVKDLNMGNIKSVIDGNGQKSYQVQKNAGTTDSFDYLSQQTRKDAERQMQKQEKQSKKTS